MQRLRELKDKVQRGSVNIKDTFARGIVGDAGTSSPSIVDVRTQQRKLRADRDEEGQLGSKRQSAAEREEDRSRRERELMLENLEPQYMDEVRCSQSHSSISFDDLLFRSPVEVEPRALSPLALAQCPCPFIQFDARAVWLDSQLHRVVGRLKMPLCRGTLC